MCLQKFIEAIYAGDVLKVALLLKSEVSQVNVSQALLHVCDKNIIQMDILSMFLSHGADLNARDFDNNTPLHLVCMWSGSVEAAQLLIEYGADVDAQSEAGSTPLHHACHKGFTACVELLVAKNANVNLENYHGSTPINSACSKGCVDSVRVLLDNGAHTNKESMGAWTPLHHAVRWGHLACAQLLIEHGVDVDADNGAALKLAKKYRHNEVAALLEKHQEVGS